MTMTQKKPDMVLESHEDPCLGSSSSQIALHGHVADPERVAASRARLQRPTPRSAPVQDQDRCVADSERAAAPKFRLNVPSTDIQDQPASAWISSSTPRAPQFQNQDRCAVEGACTATANRARSSSSLQSLQVQSWDSCKGNDETVKVARVAQYLPHRPVKFQTCARASWHTVVVALYTGSWTQMQEKKAFGGKYQGMRSGMMSEMTNLALVSALVFTVSLPLMLDYSNDIFEESFAGSGTDIVDSILGGVIGEGWIVENGCFFQDFTRFCYTLGSLAYWLSTLLSVYLLLAVNELDDDRFVVFFARRMGSALRAPFLCFILGIFVAPALIVRTMFTMRTWPLFTAMHVVLVLLVAMVHVICPRIVLCVFRAFEEDERFGRMDLSREEAEHDVRAYLHEELETADLEDCLVSLQGCTPSGLPLPLTAVATLYVKAEYTRQMADISGIPVKKLMALLHNRSSTKG